MRGGGGEISSCPVVPCGFFLTFPGVTRIAWTNCFKQVVGIVRTRTRLSGCAALRI